MTIVTTMLKLLFAMLIGFYLFKKNILTKEVNAKLSAMIVQITCPCIILNSLSTVSHDDTSMVLKLFLAGVVMYMIFPVIAWIITKLMRVPAHLRGTALNEHAVCAPCVDARMRKRFPQACVCTLCIAVWSGMGANRGFKENSRYGKTQGGQEA